jgi:hypothetical protein
VKEMRSKQEIRCQVESWIAEEEFPVRANLKVIRTTDPDYGLTEDEIQDRKEFIRCYLLRDYELLMMIPKQESDSDFFIADCSVAEEEYSAFNTHDFQRMQRPFNKYWYAMKMILERVKDLAILHSSCSDEEGRKEMCSRYEALLDREFRDSVQRLAWWYSRTMDEERRLSLKDRIASLNRRLLDCKKVWERYAHPENWDP